MVETITNILKLGDTVEHINIETFRVAMYILRIHRSHGIKVIPQ